MNWAPPGYGGQRRSPEDVKRAGWQEQGLLVINPTDPRLTWPERELIQQLGDRLYGNASHRKETAHG